VSYADWEINNISKTDENINEPCPEINFNYNHVLDIIGDLQV
jgi:hypothetical protein